MNASKIAPSVQALAKTLAAERMDGRKVVLCHGVFDLTHPGHILHLEAARQFGDILVVTLTPDRYVNKGPWRPVYNERLRALTLASMEAVDHVAVTEWPTAVETIRLLKPDVYVKGEDYEKPADDLTGKISDEEAAIRENGGTIEFTHEETFSSSDLINRYFAPYPKATQAYLEGMRQRHSADEVIERLRGLEDVKPLVVGEVIIDEYCYAQPLGKAPRESIIAAKYESLESFGGGAVATANNVAGFCKEVTLVATLGPDPAQREIVESRLASNVRLVPITTPDRQTVVKRRFLEPSHLTKMFEIQFLDDRDIAPETEAEAARNLAELLPEHDLVVVNDFGHGFLTSGLRELLCKEAPFLALNTQTNSANLGFNQITHYPRADYCCIDHNEARFASGLQYGEASECGGKLIEKLHAQSFMITMGSLGATYLRADGTAHATPALSPAVLDRVGAGDAFFAVTSPWVFRGNPDDLTGFVGNCVGALQVGIVGNREPVAPVPLYKFITSLLR